ncbi:MAG: hypothetical protein DRP29_07875, partial [Thermodesulfobacteriota bacterium]
KPELYRYSRIYWQRAISNLSKEKSIPYEKAEQELSERTFGRGRRFSDVVECIYLGSFKIAADKVDGGRKLFKSELLKILQNTPFNFSRKSSKLRDNQILNYLFNIGRHGKQTITYLSVKKIRRKVHKMFCVIIEVIKGKGNKILEKSEQEIREKELKLSELERKRLFLLNNLGNDGGRKRNFEFNSLYSVIKGLFNSAKNCLNYLDQRMIEIFPPDRRGVKTILGMLIAGLSPLCILISLPHELLHALFNTLTFPDYVLDKVRCPSWLDPGGVITRYLPFVERESIPDFSVRYVRLEQPILPFALPKQLGLILNNFVPNIYNATLGFWLVRRGKRTDNYWIVGIGMLQVIYVASLAFCTAFKLINYGDFKAGVYALLNLTGYTGDLPLWIMAPLGLESGIVVLLISYLLSLHIDNFGSKIRGRIQKAKRITRKENISQDLFTADEIKNSQDRKNDGGLFDKESNISFKNSFVYFCLKCGKSFMNVYRNLYFFAQKLNFFFKEINFRINPSKVSFKLISYTFNLLIQSLKLFFKFTSYVLNLLIQSFNFSRKSSKLRNNQILNYLFNIGRHGKQTITYLYNSVKENIFAFIITDWLRFSRKERSKFLTSYSFKRLLLIYLKNFFLRAPPLKLTTFLKNLLAKIISFSSFFPSFVHSLKQVFLFLRKIIFIVFTKFLFCRLFFKNVRKPSIKIHQPASLSNINQIKWLRHKEGSVAIINVRGDNEEHAEIVEEILKKSLFELGSIRVRTICASEKEYVDSLNEALLIIKDYVEKSGKRVIVVITAGHSNPDPQKWESVHRIIKELYRKGVIIIAAANNEYAYGRISYPAAFKEVLAVSREINKEKIIYEEKDTHILYFDNRYGEVEFKGEKRVGNSFLAPRVAISVAYMLEENPELSFEQIRERFKENNYDGGKGVEENCLNFSKDTFNVIPNDLDEFVKIYRKYFGEEEREILLREIEKLKKLKIEDIDTELYRRQLHSIEEILEKKPLPLKILFLISLLKTKNLNIFTYHIAESRLLHFIEFYPNCISK